MSWDRIRGQDSARNTFRSAVAQGRLGQAYLLVGPEGVGKRTFARELARALLCENPPAPLTACARCPACAQAAAGSHPDLLVLTTPEGKHELPVSSMREFCNRLAMKPARGVRKIGFVEDADDFNEEAANAFLKTLEEPPPGTLLLLRATSTDRQLPTILSRCQVVRFAPLVDADICAILEAHGVAEPEKRARLARLGSGSAARALALDDENLGTIRQELLDGLTGPRPDFQALATRWSGFLEELGKDKSPAQRMRASLVLAFLIEALRDALKLSLGGGIGLNTHERGGLRAYAARVGTDGIMELLERCVEADYQIARRVQLILVVEAVVDQFVRDASS
jgi:DNA polymerase-3 subunit delta'